MGGGVMRGGAMRTAAKVAALGGYRSVGVSSSRSVLAAPGDGTPRTPSATVLSAGSAVEPVRSISIASSDKGPQEVAPLFAVQKPSWEIDDWDFADLGKEEAAVVLDSQYQAPRLVFGHVPTLAESLEATSDLKDALDTLYPSSVGYAEEAAHESTHRISSAVASSMPGYVKQTFALLQGDPEVQNVVASIASDKNVWEAVMKNHKVIEFYRNHSSILPPESDATSEVVPPAEVDDDSTNAKATVASSTFKDFLRNAKAKVVEAKAKVVEVVSSLSNFIQDLFSTPSIDDKISDEAGKTSSNWYVGGGLFALGVAVILVILLKRG